MYESKITIVGRLGRTPEMRYTPTGAPVTDFSVAVDKSYTDKDGNRVEKTKWYKVVAWRRLAETCAQYLEKGRLAAIEGEVEAEAYLNNEGQAVAKLVLTATRIQFLPSGRAPSDADAEPTSAPTEDDIPF